jgi:transcriptional regulator with XRE-family HTH domain
VFTKAFIFIQISTMGNAEQIFIKKFGEKLREIRINKKLSQEMLANDANIPINQIGRIERAEISTSLSTIFKIAKALDMEPKELLNFKIK